MTEETSHNLPELLQPKIESKIIPLPRVWAMLALRSGLSFILLLLTALLLSRLGSQSAIDDASAWWLWFVTITNIVCILLLAFLAKREGMRLRDLYYVNGNSWKRDLAWFAVALAGTAVFAMLPGNLLATLLLGKGVSPNSLLIRPLPLAAIFPLFLLMPVTQGLAELPIYWGYVAPRLRAAGMKKWLVICVVGLALSLQHLFFSFQLNWQYDLWLALKFLPFALWTGFIIERRPSVLPYMMALHLLMDSSLPVLTLLVSQGTLTF